MKEEEVETVATADLETIKNYGARPIKQIILMQPAFPTHAVASQDSPFAFTTQWVFYKLLPAKAEGILEQLLQI